MAYNYRRIDVDSHVQEKPDTWTSRMSEAKWGDRIPHLEEVDGNEQWAIDGRSTLWRNGPSLCPAVMPDRLGLPNRWEEVPESVYDVSARLKAMDHDGIDAQAFYPNVAGPAGDTFQGMEPEYEAECVRAYNDYVVEEFYDVSPHRFIPLIVPPYSSIERTVGEVDRCVKKGHRGVILQATPHLRGLPHQSDPYWDPLWAMAQDLQVPVHYHSGAGFAPGMRMPPLPGTEPRRSSASVPSSTFGQMAQNFANFLFAGVLERFPGLTFVGAESGLGWVPYVLEACDHEWESCRLYERGLSRRPSEVFRQQCYIDFWYEQVSVQQYRHIIGVDRIMWETDFPHATSLWPDTERYVALSFEGVPEEEGHQILVENPKKVYKLL